MLLVLSDIDSCGEESDCECDELERESESGDEERIGGDSDSDSGSDSDGGTDRDLVAPTPIISIATPVMTISPWKEVTTIDSQPEHQYLETPGPCLPDDVELKEPEDYFSLFFSEVLYQLIADETNLYAQLLRANRPMTARSCLRNWRDLSVPELKAFIRLILPSIQDYWSTDITGNIPFFSQVLQQWLWE